MSKKPQPTLAQQVIIYIFMAVFIVAALYIRQVLECKGMFWAILFGALGGGLGGGLGAVVSQLLASSESEG